MPREGSAEEGSIKDSKWKKEKSATKGGLGFSYKGETRFKIKEGIDLSVIGSMLADQFPHTVCISEELRGAAIHIGIGDIIEGKGGGKIHV